MEPEPTRAERIDNNAEMNEESEVILNTQAEKALIRKLDWHIIPLVMSLYLFSFLDRVNIGNARLYGLEKDLGLHGNQYQIALSILFVTYILSEVPSNLVLKKCRPSRWIAFITTAWGVIAILTGACQNFAGLFVMRLLLGLAEGGLFPALAVYLTFFYTKRELALRVGYLFVSAAIAGACGGLLAFAIGHLDGTHGLRGWRWIMFLEGVPTVLLGVATWFLLADDPETAYYLSPKDKELMVLRRQQHRGSTKSAQQFHKEDMKEAFLDWKVWAFCVGQFGGDTMLYGFSTFLPTIIKAIVPRSSTAMVQVLTIPCYSLGAITYLVVARWSDHHQKRGIYAVSAGLISVAGYAMLISKSSSGVHYAGCFLVAQGLYVLVGLPLAWLPPNCPRYGKRTTATGLQLTIGNCSGIMASFLYPSKEGPRYVRGHGVTMALVAWAVLVYAFMSYYLGQQNRKRQAGEENGSVAGLSDDEIDELGDRSPRFLYLV